MRELPNILAIFYTLTIKASVFTAFFQISQQYQRFTGSLEVIFTSKGQIVPSYFRAFHSWSALFLSPEVK
ncbi:MAG TPA: hypothetical protein DIW17_03030, partial [Clostridiales bacterium]|nr:hypothetical protein [Clostridiales bacterium]